ncbi:MAG TPA: hypothetical protein VGZ47_10880 [Gemmataceae bacterium]|jgi:hypothetical protein|nr:hypothetical protein [Gemmataceae bacterium]
MILRFPSRSGIRGLRFALLLLPCLVGCTLLHYSILPNDKDAAVANTVPQLPTRHNQRVSQFIFVSDFELKPDQPLFRELADMREQIIKDLRLPTPNSLITVYLFEDRERYESFMRYRYPDLPRRRAFFVAQPKGMSSGDDLLVYTFWGDHIRQDLRHELTHAVLHSVLKDVPLWLDEGLAEYYELPPEMHGVNRQHLTFMKGEGFKPDLNRLEQLSQVQQMNPAEYREAWAWVHLMLRSKPDAKQVLLAYVKQLRTTANPGPLQPFLKQCFIDLNEALVAHLAAM